MFLATKHSYGMHNNTERGTKQNPHHVVVGSSHLWEITKAFTYVGMGIGLHYAYQRWYLKPKDHTVEEIENKEKLLELDIKESHLIQTHQEESIRFLRCDERGFNPEFCKNMLDAHNQVLQRIMKNNKSPNA